MKCFLCGEEGADVYVDCGELQGTVHRDCCDAWWEGLVKGRIDAERAERLAGEEKWKRIVERAVEGDL